MKKLLSELKVKDVFKTDIGEFIVLEQLGDQAKVITKELYLEDKQFDSSCTDYKKSELKKLCDTEILADFEKEFGTENIVEHNVDLITIDMQNTFGTVNCKVRPLTFDEARQYNEILVNRDLPDWYWTCTSWSTEERGWEWSVAVVAPSGYVSCGNCSSCRGVRPVCILKSNIFVSTED